MKYFTSRTNKNTYPNQRVAPFVPPTNMRTMIGSRHPTSNEYLEHARKSHSPSDDYLQHLRHASFDQRRIFGNIHESPFVHEPTIGKIFVSRHPPRDAHSEHVCKSPFAHGRIFGVTVQFTSNQNIRMLVRVHLGCTFFLHYRSTFTVDGGHKVMTKNTIDFDW